MNCSLANTGSAGRARLLWHNFISVALALPLSCFLFSLVPKTFGLNPAPDGGYPNNNTAEGDGALANLGSGINNTAIGRAALSGNSNGNDNTAVGRWALEVSNANQNTALGSLALDSNTADNNTAVGFEALLSNTTGTLNTALGVGALAENISGNDNTASGVDALLNNTTGIENTATGTFALSSSTKADDNTATGFQAMFKTTEGQYNTAEGAHTLWSNTIGSANTATGESALFFNTGGNNTADGYFALVSNTTGFNNVAVGFGAGSSLTTGSNNIDIGTNVGGKAGEANTIRLGKQGTQQKTFVAGIYGANEPVASGIKPLYINSTGQLGTAAPASSRRFKTNVKPMEQSSEVLLALKPVTFQYKADEEETPQFGLIAEEVAKVDPDLVVRDDDGQLHTVRYDAVNAMLLNEFLKEHQRVQNQEKMIAEQGAAIAELKSFIAQQRQQMKLLGGAVQKVSARLAIDSPSKTLSTNR